jgi:hypothetical protein
MTADAMAMMRKVGALSPLALFVTVVGEPGAPVWVPFGEGPDDPRPGQSTSYKLPVTR